MKRFHFYSVMLVLQAFNAAILAWTLHQRESWRNAKLEEFVGSPDANYYYMFAHESASTAQGVLIGLWLGVICYFLFGAVKVPNTSRWLVLCKWFSLLFGPAFLIFARRAW